MPVLSGGRQGVLAFRLAGIASGSGMAMVYSDVGRPHCSATEILVCAESGDLPNKYCPQTVETWYIPGKSPIRVSQLHRAVTLDIGTGLPACPRYKFSFRAGSVLLARALALNRQVDDAVARPFRA